MLNLGECYTNSTRILLIEEEKRNSNFFLLGRKRIEPRIFRKHFNHAEFIGEELCHVRHLRCVHFFLIGEGGYNLRFEAPYKDVCGYGYRIRLGSMDFRDRRQYDYFHIEDTYGDGVRDYLEIILKLAPNEQNRRELLDEIEEMFALDTFMGQTDRYRGNVYFEVDKKTGVIHLAPLFDFEYSLKSTTMNKELIYGNVLHSFRKEEDYIDFINEHPEFVDKLRSYLDVNLLETIERSYRSRGLKLPEHTIPFYLAFEEERKAFIRQIIEKPKIRTK